MVNGIWELYPILDYNETQVETLCDRLATGKIRILMPDIGAWQDAPVDISYYRTTAQINSWINKVRKFKKSHELEIHPWLEHGEDPDCTSESNKQTMLQLVHKLMAHGMFDGYNEDLEPVTRSHTPDYVNLINREKNLFTKSIGGNPRFWLDGDVIANPRNKIVTGDFHGWLGDYLYAIQDLHCDFDIPMIYDGGALPEAEWKNRVREHLANSFVPVIVGMYVKDTTRDATVITLSDQLGWFDDIVTEAPTGIAKLAGVSIWRYEFMSSAMWTTWNNWSTKNTYARKFVTPLFSRGGLE